MLAAAGTVFAGILMATGAVGPLAVPPFAVMLFLAWEYAATAGAYAMLPLLAWAGLPHRVALAMAVPAPVAAWRVARALRGACDDRTRWEEVTFWAVALLIGTTVAALAGVIASG